MLHKQLRKYLGELLHSLTKQKNSRIEEGRLLPDHVHMLLSVPPKHSVAEVVGYKSPIHLARVYGEQRNDFTGQHFSAKGYFV